MGSFLLVYRYILVVVALVLTCTGKEKAFIFYGMTLPTSLHWVIMDFSMKEGKIHGLIFRTWIKELVIRRQSHALCR